MSDLASFNIYKSFSHIAVIDPNSPMAGSGSLRVNASGGTAGPVNLVRNQGSRAFTSGRVRFLVDWTNNNTNALIGFCFQQSQEDLTAGAGTAYFFGMLTNTTGNHSVIIHKCTAGLGTRTSLYQSSGTYILGAQIALELSWVLDIANLGGIKFSARLGTLADFSDLAAITEMTNVVSITGVLTSTVGEGPAIITTNVNGDYRIDSVRCNRVVIGG